MTKALIYISILIAFSFAQDNFAINVSVEFMAIELLNLNGMPYILYSTATLEPGDTAVCDSADGIWLNNQSNIPVGFIARAYDDTTFILMDTLIWVIDTIVGTDTCATGLALYSVSKSPAVSDVQWLDENFKVIASGLSPGEDKYGYIFFIAPTDSVKYAEPQHRLKMVIAIYPE